MCIQLKTDLVKTKCGEWWLITITCVTFVQKDFYIRTVITQVLTKYQFFMKLPQILHAHKCGKFNSNYAYTNCLNPINFMAVVCKKYSN